MISILLLSFFLTSYAKFGLLKEDLYKYLVQGEYVEFDVEKMETNKQHDNQATKITGMFGGDLMCETRSKNRDMSKSRDGLTQIKRGRRNNINATE